LVLGLAVGLSAGAQADTLVMRNGDRVEGTWKGGDAGQVRFQPNGKPDAQLFARADIARVEFSAPGPVASVKLKDVVFDFGDAVAEGDTLRVTVFVTNNGNDIKDFWLASSSRNPPWPKAFDDMGNEFTTLDVLIGNVSAKDATLVNGVRTKTVITYHKMPTSRGVVQLPRLRQLVLAPFFDSKVQGEVRFEGIEIKK
jgi:hypothetical protein